MSILDDIKAEVGAAFADPGLFFSEASVTRTVSVTPGGSGWIEGTPSVQAYPCYAMIDTYSDHLRAVQDIPDTHVKLMVLGASIDVDLAIVGHRSTLHNVGALLHLPA